MQGSSIVASDLIRLGSRAVIWGIVAIVAVLALTAVLLFLNLPDAGAFNDRVERVFVENADLTSQAEIKLLEILAQSGTAFSETLVSYRIVIFVLLVFATGLLVTSFVVIVILITLNRRMAMVEKQGLQISQLVIDRATNSVAINDMEFKLTPAAVETLAVLAEARIDDDVLSGAAIEAVISGRSEADCDEAAGATRIKRLRDTLGNQLISEVLVKNIARQGYMLAIDAKVISLR
ncbi:winged helix-turn-helix domain-containing protein [Natronohydrobacter thiooxidans]|uniref:winged helix-turn-helix domain-containing protein n=1 Tax=Natronohydrobacter thiooxidans TaxID=87172 RepID=UPI0008FF4F18|nr:response regulator transcription factor [Natronohydrobacter thiooxidans]